MHELALKNGELPLSQGQLKGLTVIGATSRCLPPGDGRVKAEALAKHRTTVSSRKDHPSGTLGVFRQKAASLGKLHASKLVVGTRGRISPAASAVFEYTRQHGGKAAYLATEVAGFIRNTTWNDLYDELPTHLPGPYFDNWGFLALSEEGRLRVIADGGNTPIWQVLYLDSPIPTDTPLFIIPEIFTEDSLTEAGWGPNFGQLVWLVSFYFGETSRRLGVELTSGIKATYPETTVATLWQTAEYRIESLRLLEPTDCRVSGIPEPGFKFRVVTVGEGWLAFLLLYHRKMVDRYLIRDPRVRIGAEEPNKMWELLKLANRMEIPPSHATSADLEAATDNISLDLAKAIWEGYVSGLREAGVDRLHPLCTVGPLAYGQRTFHYADGEPPPHHVTGIMMGDATSFTILTILSLVVSEIALAYDSVPDLRGRQFPFGWKNQPPANRWRYLLQVVGDDFLGLGSRTLFFHYTHVMEEHALVPTSPGKHLNSSRWAVIAEESSIKPDGTDKWLEVDTVKPRLFTRWAKGVPKDNNLTYLGKGQLLWKQQAWTSTLIERLFLAGAFHMMHVREIPRFVYRHPFSLPRSQGGLQLPWLVTAEVGVPPWTGRMTVQYSELLWTLASAPAALRAQASTILYGMTQNDRGDHGLEVNRMVYKRLEGMTTLPPPDSTWMAGLGPPPDVTFQSRLTEDYRSLVEEAFPGSVGQLLLEITNPYDPATEERRSRIRSHLLQDDVLRQAGWIPMHEVARWTTRAASVINTFGVTKTDTSFSVPEADKLYVFGPREYRRGYKKGMTKLYGLLRSDGIVVSSPYETDVFAGEWWDYGRSRPRTFLLSAFLRRLALADPQWVRAERIGSLMRLADTTVRVKRRGRLNGGPWTPLKRAINPDEQVIDDQASLID
jgi:hypothetical protein